MASRMSVAKVRVPYSFERSRDFAGMRHSFGRSAEKVYGEIGSLGIRSERASPVLLPKEWGKCGKHDSFRRSGAKAGNTTPPEEDV